MGLRFFANDAAAPTVILITTSTDKVHSGLSDNVDLRNCMSLITTMVQLAASQGSLSSMICVPDRGCGVVHGCNANHRISLNLRTMLRSIRPNLRQPQARTLDVTPNFDVFSKNLAGSCMAAASLRTQYSQISSISLSA